VNGLGDIQMDGSNPSSLTITGTVNAASLQNLPNNYVNGNISIIGAQNYTGFGLVLETRSTGAINVGDITSSGVGSIVSFTHAGNLNLQGNINDLGTFVQNGTSGGTVFVGTTLPTSIQIGSGGAAFNRNVTLNRALTLSAPGNIAFSQNLNSATGQSSDLNITSSGVLSFANNVGNLVALGAINASTATLSGITPITLVPL